LLSAALASVRPANLDAAFMLAGSLDTGIAAEQIRTPIDALVDEVIRDPALARRMPGWVQSDAVSRRLAERLDTRLSSGDEVVARAIRAGTWDWLSPKPWRVDPDVPLSRWFALRELEGQDAARRSEVLTAVQRTMPNVAWSMLLPTAAGLQPDEVVGWIRTHGDLDPALGREIEHVIADLGSFPAWQRMGGAKVLHELRRREAGVPASLRARSDAQLEIIALFEKAATERSEAESPALRMLGRRFAGRLNGLYGDWIARAILDAEDSRAALALADGPGRSGVVAIARSMLEGDLRAAAPSAMLSAVRLLDQSLGTWADAARGALDAVWDDHSADGVRSRLLASVEGRLRREERANLDRYLETQSKGRFTRGVVRGAKSMFGKDS
jgi:hypothetical protein